MQGATPYCESFPCPRCIPEPCWSARTACHIVMVKLSLQSLFHMYQYWPSSGRTISAQSGFFIFLEVLPAHIHSSLVATVQPYAVPSLIHFGRNVDINPHPTLQGVNNRENPAGRLDSQATLYE
jgi:hypothetical protein